MCVCVCVCVCVCARAYVFSMQLIRVGSVDLDQKSLKETSELIGQQPRPVELMFERRRNELRHMLRLVLMKDDEKTGRGTADYYSWLSRGRPNKYDVMKF